MANTYLPGIVTIPSALSIISITQANPMVVSINAQPSTQNNSYASGMQVRLSVPSNYGMWQANGMVGTITGVSGNNISLNINSTNFDAFTIPSNGQGASISPSGSQNQQYNNTNVTNLPFKSLNNIGN